MALQKVLCLRQSCAMPGSAAARRTVRWLVRVTVSVAIVAYVLVHVDTRELVHRLAGVRLAPVGLALALYLAGQWLSAFKWSLLGRAVGIGRPLADYVRFYFIGMFVNLFGPSTIGGDVARGLYLGDGHRPGLALNSVLFDRLSGLAVLMALGGTALLVYPGHRFPWPLEAMLGGGGLALLLAWWTCPRLVRLLPERNALRRQVEVDLEPFWRDRGLLARVAGTSLVFHLMQVCVQYVLARAAGAEVPFSYCLVYHPVVSVIAALPVSVAGLGVREGGYLYFFGRIGIDGATAVTASLLWFAVSSVASLIGGVVFLASGAELPRLVPRPETSSRAVH